MEEKRETEKARPEPVRSNTRGPTSVKLFELATGPAEFTWTNVPLPR
jgi:hypothetical protein